MFDYPLDQEVVQEGSYYPQQGVAANEIPWQYSVVDVNYQPVSGVTYEELSVLYIPDLDTYLEDEALRITGNPLDDSCNNVSYRYPNPCSDPSSPDYGNCGGGGGGTSPPLIDQKKPAGQIRVRDVTDNGANEVGVRRVRVVARRWFKIDLMYTDDNGFFQSTKKFKNKVNVFVKFQNELVSTRGLRGVRIWQSLFPVKYGLGKYSGNLSRIDCLFASVGFGDERSNRNWWAAQVMNGYLEFNENASALGIGAAPSDLRILLTSFAGDGAGSTAMNYHRTNVGTITAAYVQQFFVQPINALRAQVYYNLFNDLRPVRTTDMVLGYNTPANGGAWTSDRVKQLLYHELGHSSHFVKVGQSWWADLVYAETYEIRRFGVHGTNSPYGTGDDGFLSDYISLAESWAEHVGRTVADRFYGLNSSAFITQHGTASYFNNSVIPGSSHINYLEDFSPFRTNDPFRWIPDGIYNDLFDNRNDALVPSPSVLINDAVDGYTDQQMYNALEEDVKSLVQFKVRLLNQNGNNQATQVTQLFNQYGY